MRTDFAKAERSIVVVGSRGGIGERCGKPGGRRTNSWEHSCNLAGRSFNGHVPARQLSDKPHTAASEVLRNQCCVTVLLFGNSHVWLQRLKTQLSATVNTSVCLVLWPHTHSLLVHLLPPPRGEHTLATPLSSLFSYNISKDGCTTAS